MSTENCLRNEILKVIEQTLRGKLGWLAGNVCASAVARFRSCVLSHETKRGTKITLIAYTSPRYCRSILLALVGLTLSFFNFFYLFLPIVVRAIPDWKSHFLVNLFTSLLRRCPLGNHGQNSLKLITDLASTVGKTSY